MCYIIYTDGSTLGNGKENAEGGYGVVVVKDDTVVFAHSKRTKGTTNNREEMKAIIWALATYGDKNPIVYSDSSYCVNTFNQWMNNWKKNNWLKSDNKPPENLGLIQLYDKLKSMGKRIDLRYIKGHAGNKYNELADQLATGKILPKDIIGY